MTIRFSVAARNAALDAALNLADAGAGPGTIKIYSGTQPANGDTAEAGTLLATFTLADPAFSAATGGVKDLDADPDLTVNAAATGTAGWARCEDSNGNNVFDGSVGTTGADFTISSTSLTSGSPVTLTLGAITNPA
jgi:hypothetical protein